MQASHHQARTRRPFSRNDRRERLSHVHLFKGSHRHECLPSATLRPEPWSGEWVSDPFAPDGQRGDGLRADRLPLLGVAGDFNLARLGGLGDRDKQREHPGVVIRGDVLGVEILPQH